jgi:hypothetical protein
LGTDRDEYGKGACPCGKGTISVDHCSPDYPWGGGSWYEASLSCVNCQKAYAILDDSGDKPKLVRKVDVAKREQATAAWHAERKSIEATPEFKAAKARIDYVVSMQRSMAAKHRVLRTAGLAHKSIGAFRKNPTYRVSATEVAEAARALGFPDASLDAMTEHLDALWEKTRFDPPAVRTGIPGLQQ